MCASIINCLVKNRAVLLLSSLLINLVTVCAKVQGAIQDNDSPLSKGLLSFSTSNSTEETITVTEEIITATPNNTTPINNLMPIWEISTGKMITLLLISFAIPLAFMLLLFWRLQREKKYMNARGALVYRETVLVPSYTVSDANNTNINNENVIQMHTALYDTPPDYEEIVNSTERNNDHVENETAKSKNGKTEELPPPYYSTVHI